MKQNLFLSCLLGMLLFCGCQSSESVRIIPQDSENPRLAFGVEKLQEALASKAYTLLNQDTDECDYQIIIGNWKDESFRQSLEKFGWTPAKAPEGKEAFCIHAEKGLIVVCGSDDSGVLYGCLELCDRLKAGKRLPKSLDFSDKPEMVLRGTCIGVQKPYYLPGRTVYEYPYTEEVFPWFYDKELWIKYLDMLVENRMNSLYLWNGHPFASLVKLPDYPYALEVSEEDFKKNEEIFGFLTEEANKRGIWVIQMFYNIIVSKPFAEHHHIPTQNRKVVITPLLSDYTRKSVAAFIEKYPNVGLLVCLGEALNTHEDDVNWFTNTIIPGVQDGLKALNITEEPPIVLRAHDTNCKMVMDAALPLYKNLYTMNKYNGESLCTYQPRGPWTATHQSLSALGSIHISNVHILANLEPFRYGSPDFIQKSVQAMHEIHGANGLHLYPQASYWDWPYSADKLADGSRLYEMDRDRIWYEAWARYAWNAYRDREEEIDYWAREFSEFYGCNKAQSKAILEAYEQTGEISTKLSRKFAITEGNRQTFLLGMFMSQLVNPNRWTVYPDFANSCGPEGEKLEVWAEREWKKEAHAGETPPQLVAETREHARKAVEAIDRISSVPKNQAEFERLKNDIHCYKAFTDAFTDKIEAAMSVLRYTYSNDIADLEKAYRLMESSLAHYKILVDLTKDSYLYANSMQTPQRRIPAGGGGAKNKTWAELLPLFEKEMQDFARHIEELKTPNTASTEIKPFTPAKVSELSCYCGTQKADQVSLQEGNSIIASHRPIQITGLAPELKGLMAFRLNNMLQENANTEITFRCDKAVTLWIGYYAPIKPSNRYMSAPRLETDASANEYGQADIKIAHAIAMEGMPSVNVHAYQFEAGKHHLNLGKGMCLVLGFSEPVETFTQRDAGFSEKTAIDWLFY